MSATVTVNGKCRPWRDITVGALMAEAGFAPDAGGVAVALNGAVVRRAEWPQFRLAPGDAVEIVEIVRGG